MTRTDSPNLSSRFQPRNVITYDGSKRGHDVLSPFAGEPAVASEPRQGAVCFFFARHPGGKELILVSDDGSHRPKMEVRAPWKTKIIYKSAVFRFHVTFRGLTWPMAKRLKLFGDDEY